jgi:transcription elongation GreA/GreB family factor
VSDRIEIKRQIVHAIIAKLEEEVRNMRRAAADAREAATHEEAKPENDKDTRALEASYLAGGQAARVRQIEIDLKAMQAMPLLDLSGKRIQASAMITLEDEEETRTTYFLASAGGGASIAVGTLSVQVITPQSPRGQALLGRTEGETIEVRRSRALSQAAQPPDGKTGPAQELAIVEVW